MCLLEKVGEKTAFKMADEIAEMLDNKSSNEEVISKVDKLSKKNKAWEKAKPLVEEVMRPDIRGQMEPTFERVVEV